VTTLSKTTPSSLTTRELGFCFCEDLLRCEISSPTFKGKFLHWHGFTFTKKMIVFARIPFSGLYVVDMHLKVK
jgi:hypothetical protein